MKYGKEEFLVVYGFVPCEVGPCHHGMARPQVAEGPCHHGMARPQVADGGTASDMEGSCE